MKTRKIDFVDVLAIRKLAAKSIRANEQIRLGQAIFNASYELFPIATNKLRNTIYDCFYDSERINMFLEKLREFDAE